MQTNEPALYASVDAYSDNLYKPYALHSRIDEYEKTGFWKTMLQPISITQEIISDGGEPIDSDPLKDMVENYEEWAQEAILEIESYTEETILRQLIYYNCPPKWSFEECE